MATFDVELWRFVRGETSPQVFEAWLYATSELESRLGHQAYGEAISTDFREAEAVWQLRVRLAEILRKSAQARCVCIRLRDLDLVDMGSFGAPAPAFERTRKWSSNDVIANFDEVRRRPSPIWWLWAARCRECGECWLVADESRQNDVYCLRRLSADEMRAIENADQWPLDFDRYRDLLRLGLSNGRSVRFVDPLNSSLVETIADLAKEHPGVSLSEIAPLLNLDAPLAVTLARLAVERYDVSVVLDL